MSTSTSAGVCGCISVLNQQSETQRYHNQDEGDRSELSAKGRSQSDVSSPKASKSCTVVENGRVVVKPIQLDVSKETTS